MILLPLYAAIVWITLYMLRQRWLQAFVMLASLAPVSLVSHVCVWHISLPPGEPRPVWLYFVSAAYAGLLLIVGLTIVIAKPRAHHLCHKCAYDLSGSEIGICPECGTPVRCRRCHHELTSDTFEPCRHCGEPFPSFEPVTLTRDDPEDVHLDAHERIRRFVQQRSDEAT